VARAPKTRQPAARPPLDALLHSQLQLVATSAAGTPSAVVKPIGQLTMPGGGPVGVNVVSLGGAGAGAGAGAAAGSVAGSDALGVAVAGLQSAAEPAPGAAVVVPAGQAMHSAVRWPGE
jgi:hypothetical protein